MNVEELFFEGAELLRVPVLIAAVVALVVALAEGGATAASPCSTSTSAGPATRRSADPP